MYELRKKCLDDYLNERVVGMYDTEYIQTASGELVLQRKKKMQTQNVAPPTLTTSNIDMFLKMLPSNKRKRKIEMENVEEEKNKKNEKKNKNNRHGLRNVKKSKTSKKSKSTSRTNSLEKGPTNNATQSKERVVTERVVTTLATSEKKPFSLHAALRRRVPHHFLFVETAQKRKGDFNVETENLQAWRAAEEYFYLLHDSNPGGLLVKPHARRVTSFSQTGPLPEDTMYLMDNFVSPGFCKNGTYEEDEDNQNCGILAGSIRMIWDEGCTKMIELPTRSPLVLVKICTASAYDDGGNMLCRFEMRAIKKLARWTNGSLVWPLKVVGNHTLVELQKI